MKTIKEIMENPKVTVTESGEQYILGSFRFDDGSFASFVVSEAEGGIYDHVSVAPYKRRKTPSWDQMCEVKDVCWNNGEEAYQIHPKEGEYINFIENCLHLWARHDGKGLFDD